MPTSMTSSSNISSEIVSTSAAASSASKKRKASSRSASKAAKATKSSPGAKGDTLSYNIVSGAPAAIKCDCLIVGVFAKGGMPTLTKQVDKASGGAIGSLIKNGDHDGAVGHVATLYDLPDLGASRLMIVGLGNEDKLNDKRYQRATVAALKTAMKSGAKTAASTLCAIDYGKTTIGWRVRYGVDAIANELYVFDELKQSGRKKAKKQSSGAKGLQSVDFVVGNARQAKSAKTGLAHGLALAEGTHITRDLGNLPGNICTPTYLGEQAQKLGKSHGLKVTVYDEERMRKLKMNTLLSVSAGSAEEARLIVMEYNGGRKGAKPVALVGKGITFDTGGISLKPGATMDEMKFDMCGAASVFGTMAAIASMKLKLNVVGIVAAAENMPGSKATKPGDIIESMKGLTVEILNTDAEGRLVLCDTLTFTERFKPTAVVDMATLTGACVVALGSPATGLFANDQDLADELLNAGDETGDRAWQLPLWDEYQSQLNSNFADLANIGGREAGAVTAACFLSRFAESYPWAHLDIAGSAWKRGAQKGATARPVRLLTQFLMSRANLKS